MSVTYWKVLSWILWSLGCGRRPSWSILPARHCLRQWGGDRRARNSWCFPWFLLFLCKKCPDLGNISSSMSCWKSPSSSWTSPPTVFYVRSSLPENMALLPYRGMHSMSITLRTPLSGTWYVGCVGRQTRGNVPYCIELLLQYMYTYLLHVLSTALHDIANSKGTKIVQKSWIVTEICSKYLMNTSLLHLKKLFPNKV